ncbi:O-antigen ligase family protein [Neptuniibacter sp. QD72_48]|uniref:O-antigen ligase family protein n=1 Tax=unclassified Neptuniibacter TaxID=2630693 RepID=UPI0039F60A27
MTRFSPMLLGIACLIALLLAPIIIGSGLIVHPLAPFLIPIGAAAVVIILLYPFFGLFLLVLFAQLDALANLIFSALPVSGVKVLALLTLAGVIINLKKERDTIKELLKEPAVIAMFFFCLFMGLSFFWAENMEYAVWSVRRMASLMLLFVLTIVLVKTTKHLKYLLYCLAIAALMSSVLVIFDSTVGGNILSSSDAATTAKWEGVSRSSGGSDYNPTTAATMLLTGTLLAAILFIELPKLRFFMFMATLLGTAGIVLSFARSAALVYAIVGIWIAWRYRHHKVFPLACYLGFFLCLAALPFIPEQYWERLATLLGGGSDWTLGRRLGYNLIGVDLLVQNPLLGVGPGNFKEYYVSTEYRFVPGRTPLPRQLHNMYLSVAVEFGLIAFSCLMFVILRGLHGLRAIANTDVENDEFTSLVRALFICFIAYLMASVFVPNEYNKYTWILAGLSIAALRIRQKESKT